MEEQVLLSAVGAFLGAFFAFAFVRLGEWSSAVYDRAKRNYNALAEMEYGLLRLIDAIQNNIAGADQIIELPKEAAKRQQAPISFNDLNQLGFSSQLAMDLTVNQLKNELMELGADIDRINMSTANSNRSYSEMRNAYLSKSLDKQNYQSVVQTHAEKTAELKLFLTSAQEKAIAKLSVCRSLLKDKPFFTRIVHWFVVQNYPDQKSIEKEEKNLRKELEDSQKESGEEIAKILSQTTTGST